MTLSNISRRFSWAVPSFFLFVPWPVESANNQQPHLLHYKQGSNSVTSVTCTGHNWTHFFFLPSSALLGNNNSYGSSMALTISFPFSETLYLIILFCSPQDRKSVV